MQHLPASMAREAALAVFHYMKSENRDKLLTVIIAVLNREHLLPRTLESIYDQSLHDFDLIIVDNGSDDGTMRVIEKWMPKFSGKGINATVMTESRRGISRARNKGLTAVKTPWVMFFDSDDEMESNHLQTIHEELTARPDTELMWFDIKLRDEDGWTEVKSVEDSDVMRGHILHSSLASARFVVRTALLNSLGGFDESIQAWEDLELGVRLLSAAKDTRKLNCVPCVVVHSHSDSITGNGYSRNRESIERAMDLCEEALRQSGNEKHVIWIDVKRMVVAGHYAREGEKRLSERLSDKVLEHTASAGRRIILGFVRDMISYFGRGGCAIAKALIRTEKDSQEEK